MDRKKITLNKKNTYMWKPFRCRKATSHKQKHGVGTGVGGSEQAMGLPYLPHYLPHSLVLLHPV